MTVIEYEYYVPTRAIFGVGKAGQVGRILKQHIPGGNVMLITDSGPWVRPLLDQVKMSLAEEGFLNIIYYDGVSPNPKLSECLRGINDARQNGSELFIAVGGGSVMDAAKKIAKDSEAKFFITIPTTAGTGSHINEWSVLIKDESNEKISMQNRAADIAILDPAATVSMPPVVTLFTGLDSFSHGMEAFFGTRASVLTDIQALKGCQLLVENISEAMENGRDLVVRARMLEADLLTGAAMLNAGLGIVHCIANIIPGFYPRYSHGQICASLLKAAAAYNREAIPAEKFALMAPLVEKAGKIYERAVEKYKIEPIVLECSHLETITKLGAVNVNGETNPRKITLAALDDLCSRTFIVQ